MIDNPVPHPGALRWTAELIEDSAHEGDEALKVAAWLRSVAQESGAAIGAIRMTINTQNQSDIASRLRCKYPVGPIGDNGGPEFGWRDFSGPAPEGTVLPTRIMLDAADAIDAQTAEIAGLKSQVEMLEACAAGDATLTEGQQREIARLRHALSRFASLQLDTTALPEDFGSMILRARAALSQEE